MVATLEASSPITSRQHLFGCHLHPAEREQFLSQVFEGGTEDLSVVEDALDRWQGGAHEEADLLFSLADPLFQPFDSLVDGVSTKKILFENGGRPSAEINAAF